MPGSWRWPSRPSRSETQWYFQRYVAHLPSAGEIVLFDRSWYNRAGVERVMGYCTPTQYLDFMRETPEFERMLVHSGIHLVKLWFSVSRAEQAARFAPPVDPVRRWKLSPDRPGQPRQVGRLHGGEGDHVLPHRHRRCAVDGVKWNDKKRARLEAMRSARAARLPVQGPPGSSAFPTP